MQGTQTDREVRFRPQLQVEKRVVVVLKDWLGIEMLKFEMKPIPNSNTQTGSLCMHIDFCTSSILATFFCSILFHKHHKYICKFKNSQKEGEKKTWISDSSQLEKLHSTRSTSENIDTQGTHRQMPSRCTSRGHRYCRPRWWADHPRWSRSRRWRWWPRHHLGSPWPWHRCLQPGEPKGQEGGSWNKWWMKLVFLSHWHLFSFCLFKPWRWRSKSKAWWNSPTLHRLPTAPWDSCIPCRRASAVERPGIAPHQGTDLLQHSTTAHGDPSHLSSLCQGSDNQTNSKIVFFVNPISCAYRYAYIYIYSKHHNDVLYMSNMWWILSDMIYLQSTSQGWESEKESIASRLFNDPDSFLLHVFSKQNHLQFLFPTSYLAQSFPSCLPLLELKDLVKSQNTQLLCYMDPQCPSSDIAWGNHPPGRRGDPSHWDEILTSAFLCGVGGWCPKYTLHIHMEKMLRYTRIEIDGSTEIYLECVQVNTWMNKSINIKYNSNNRSFPVFIVCIYI